MLKSRQLARQRRKDFAPGFCWRCNSSGSSYNRRRVFCNLTMVLDSRQKLKKTPGRWLWISYYIASCCRVEGHHWRSSIVNKDIGDNGV